MATFDAGAIANQILGFGSDAVTGAVGNAVHNTSIATSVSTVAGSIESTAKTSKVIAEDYETGKIPATNKIRIATEEALAASLGNLVLVQTNIATTKAPRIGWLG
jgi:hypothetical protein